MMTAAPATRGPALLVLDLDKEPQVTQHRDPDDGNRGYWREYRLGAWAEAAHVTGTVLIACLVGLAASFAAILLIGIAGEEELVVGFTEFIDELSRASLGVLLGLGLVCWGLYAGAHSLRSVGTSRALVRAADDGADPRAVPHPVQVEAVVTRPHVPLLIFLASAAAMALLVVAAYVAERDRLPLVAGIVVVVVAAAGAAAAYALSWPAHRDRRHRIAEHWTAHYEQTAWGRARNASGRSVADALGEMRGSLSRGLGLMLVGTLGGMLSGTLLELFLFVRFPGSVSGPGMRLNDRGSFSDGIEAVLDGALWVVVGLGLTSMVVAVVGSVLAAAGLAAERAELLRLLDDPVAGRPSPALLARHAGRRPVALALVGAGLGAFVLVPSLGVLFQRADEPSRYDDTANLFAGLRPFGLGGLALGVLLIVVALVSNAVVAVHGYPLRDRLQRRWPVVPGKPDDKDSVRYAVRTKPTLRRQDVGLW